MRKQLTGFFKVFFLKNVIEKGFSFNLSLRADEWEEICMYFIKRKDMESSCKSKKIIYGLTVTGSFWSYQQ